VGSGSINSFSSSSSFSGGSSFPPSFDIVGVFGRFGRGYDDGDASCNSFTSSSDQ